MKRASVCAALAVLITLVTHLYLLDGLHGFFLRSIDPTEDTVFAGGYRESSFRWLRIGATEEDILNSLGPPLAQVWVYEIEGRPQVSFRIEEELVSEVFFDRTSSKRTVSIGNTRKKVIEQHGYPSQEAWIYSSSPSESSYRKRVLILEGGKLVQKKHSFYGD